MSEADYTTLKARLTAVEAELETTKAENTKLKAKLAAMASQTPRPEPASEVDVFPMPLDMQAMRASIWFNIAPRDIHEDYVFPGLPVGAVGALIAPGGYGKSFIALELVTAVACPQADLAGFTPPKAGLAAYINAEDGYFPLAKRLAWIGERLPLEARNTAAASLSIGLATGCLIDLGRKPLSTDLDPEPDEEYGDSITDVEVLAKRFDGYRLIVIDTLTRFHSLDENNNGQMSQLVSILEYLAKRPGAAVLFIHHTNKAAIREGSTDSQAAGRGASALTDNVRYSAFLARMTEAEAKECGVSPDDRGLYLRFGVSKQNYGLPQEDRWLERKEGGVLVPAKLPNAQPRPEPRKGKTDDGRFSKFDV